MSERARRARTLFVEGMVILLSILAAFALDAWWDGHKEGQRERALLSALLEDFQSSRPGLVDRLTLSRRNATGTAGLLALVDAPGAASTGEARVRLSLP